MDWIKRNLFFVIGAAVALLAIIGAGFYTWSGYSHNASAREDLNAKYAELKRLYESPLSPGDGEKVDNIKLAREQLAEVRKVTAQSSKRFQHTPRIMVDDVALDGTNVNIALLSRGMSETIKRLQLDATNSGVVLLPSYKFSFEQEADRVRLAAASLAPLAEQLSEVKVLADVLIQAKVNSIDAIQRERVAAEDMAGSQSDYLEAKSQTNELAITTPYQVVFRSFTPELAAVLCGYAGCSYGVVVKRVNVETAPAATQVLPGFQPTYAPQPVYPTPVPPTVPRPFAEDARYGRPGIPTYQQPAPAAPVAATPTAPSGPKTVLNEKQLRVTMLLEFVKLLPTK
jgi:hypothetical protein